MNYADIKCPDIQDGDGVRVALYVSGCHFHCKECHNKEAWDFNYGKKFTQNTSDYIIDLLNKPYISGLSLLGGEPLEMVNQIGLLKLVKRIKSELPDKNIWLWTGYDFEKDILNQMYLKNNTTKEFLQYVDIIVDGQFEIDKKIVDLKFRGSTNQRKVDVQRSIKTGKLVTLRFGDESRYEPKIMYFEEYKKKNDSKEFTEVSALKPTGTEVELKVNTQIQKKYEIQENQSTIAATSIV